MAIFIIAVLLANLLPMLASGALYAQRLHSGMSVSQVKQALGQPQQVFTNNDGSLELNYKSWWAGGLSIGFDTNGIVGRWTSM